MRIKLRNAVLFKDMMQLVKKAKLPVIALVINIILAVIALTTMLVISGICAAYGNVSPRSMIWLFISLIYAECFMMGLMMPTLTAGTISGEREKQTLEVMLTTRMSTKEIVFGKFFSSTAMIGLLMLTSLPVLALVFVYGGVNLGQLILVMLSMLISCMFISSIGIWFSAVLKKTIAAIILTYLAVNMVLSLGFILVGISNIAVEFLNQLILELGVASGNGVNTLNARWSIYFLYLNPLVTVFDSLGAVVGYDFDGEVYRGMYDIAMGISGYSPKNIFLKGWSIISCILQLGATYLILCSASSILDPVKKKKKKAKTYRYGYTNTGGMQPNMNGSGMQPGMNGYGMQPDVNRVGYGMPPDGQR